VTCFRGIAVARAINCIPFGESRAGKGPTPRQSGKQPACNAGGTQVWPDSLDFVLMGIMPAYLAAGRPVD
jgi:hypothetical protein